MRPRLLLATFVLAAITACLVPSLEELGGKNGCDDAHPCATGFRCEAAVCVPGAAAGNDGGAAPSDGGVDAGACVRAGVFCEGKQQVRCANGGRELVADCAVGGGACEDLRGCLAPCSAGSCAAGKVCELATNLCVAVSSCTTSAECGEGACLLGACVGLPANPPTVVIDGGAAAPDFSCYGADAGVVPPGGPSAMRGSFLFATGKPSSGGPYTLKIYRASEFNGSGTPTALASVSSGTGDGGQATFRVEKIPVEEELVAATEGKGAVPSYQYLTLHGDQKRDEDGGTVVDQNVVFYDEALWATLNADAKAPKIAGRAGVAVQILDCRQLRVSDLSAGLGTPAAAAYTYPDVIGIDPTRTSTSNTGRVFFLDVPAVATRLVTARRQGAQAVVVREQPIRTVPSGVTIVTVKPR